MIDEDQAPKFPKGSFVRMKEGQLGIIYRVVGVPDFHTSYYTLRDLEGPCGVREEQIERVPDDLILRTLNESPLRRRV